MASSVSSSKGGWSWREGPVVEVFGYRFVFRPWALILVVVVAGFYPFTDDWPGRAVFTMAVLASVVVHELAHAAVARRRHLLVAGAGPAASIACGLLAFVVALPITIVTRPSLGPLYVLAAIGAANVVLALLNLLPFWPFDGGHLATAVLELATGSLRRAQRIVGFVGLTAAGAGAVWVMVRSFTLDTFEPDLIATVAFIGFSAGLLLRSANEPDAGDGEPVPSN